MPDISWQQNAHQMITVVQESRGRRPGAHRRPAPSPVTLSTSSPTGDGQGSQLRRSIPQVRSWSSMARKPRTLSSPPGIGALLAASEPMGAQGLAELCRRTDRQGRRSPSRETRVTRAAAVSTPVTRDPVSCINCSHRHERQGVEEGSPVGEMVVEGGPADARSGRNARQVGQRALVNELLRAQSLNEAALDAVEELIVKNDINRKQLG